MEFLSANTAREIANTVRNKQREKAEEFLRDEWEAFLEPRIKKVANEGNYRISYFWERSIFQENQVHPYDFVAAFKSFIVTLGYNSTVETIEIMGIINKVTVTISWEESK